MVKKIAKDRKALPDGWHDLPNGGALMIKNGWPFMITDKGAWSIDELSLLREAENFSGFKLNYTCSRARRWRQSRIIEALFKIKGIGWNWCLAKVFSGACERCGDEAGSFWWPDPEGGSDYWIGTGCKEELENGLDWDDD